MSLEREYQTYLTNKPKLLSMYNEGEFVVIQGEEILGVWSDLQDALYSGYKQFGMDGIFLVQEIREEEPVLTPERILAY